MTAAHCEKAISVMPPTIITTSQDVDDKASEMSPPSKKPSSCSKRSSKANPYASAGFFSLVSFSFANQIIDKIFARGHVERSDVYPIT